MSCKYERVDGMCLARDERARQKQKQLRTTSKVYMQTRATRLSYINSHIRDKCTNRAACACVLFIVRGATLNQLKFAFVTQNRYRYPRYIRTHTHTHTHEILVYRTLSSERDRKNELLTFFGVHIVDCC